MSKFGYVGRDRDIPQQAFKSNAGVLSVNEHLVLSQEEKLTQYGQLELIETQNVTSAVSNIDFLDLKTDIYQEHLLTCTDVTTVTNTKHLVARFSNDGGATFDTGSYINSYLSNNGAGGQASGVNTFLQYLSSSLGDQSNEKGNGYIKFYNLGSSRFRATCNSVFSDFNASAAHQTSLGFAQHNATKKRVDAIRLTGHASTTWTGQYSLYGVRFS